MIKYRVWDLELQKFIHPVIDITNDFHGQYPDDRFIFDRSVSFNGTELFQNDIVIKKFHESGRYNNTHLFHCVILSDTHVCRFDEYLFRFKGFGHLYPCPPLQRFKATWGVPDLELVGNVHENLDILHNDFDKYKQLKEENAKK